MENPPDGFLDALELQMKTHGLDAESLARASGVSDSNVRALQGGYWNFHIAKAVCMALNMPLPRENSE